MMSRQISLAIVSMALSGAALLGGCSSESPTESVGIAPATGDDRDHESDSHGHEHDDHDLGNDQAGSAPTVGGQLASAADLAEAATRIQKPYLEDGVVTEAEREAAFLGWMECLEASGLTVGHHELLPDDVSISYYNQALGLETVRRLGEECRVREFRVVQHVFTAQNAITDAESTEWLSEVVECVQGSGIEVPREAAVLDLFDAAPITLGDCLDTVYATEAAQ